MSRKTVLESSKYIAENAQHVKINPEKVRENAEMIFQQIESKQYDITSWKKNELNPKVADEKALDWIFLVDTLNFCFWSSSDTLFSVEYKDKTFTGYWSLCAAINRALDNGIPFTSAEFFAKIDEKQFDEIFRSSSSELVPMREDRIRVLREAGTVLLEKFGGSFANCVKQSDQSAAKLLDIITKNFKCYDDIGNFNGEVVCFHKRAQILIADTWACFEGRDLGYFKDIDSITMFADYRVPQILNFLGILDYSETLQKQLIENPFFEHNCAYEMEIRGCSIYSVELLLQEVKEIEKKRHVSVKKRQNVNAIILDFYLWDTAIEKKSEIKHVPIHKTKSIFY